MTTLAKSNHFFVKTVAALRDSRFTDDDAGCLFDLNPCLTRFCLIDFSTLVRFFNP